KCFVLHLGSKKRAPDTLLRLLKGLVETSFGSHARGAVCGHQWTRSMICTTANVNHGAT
ncbi:unnamed protein product, partial [Mycena citricolor]